MRSGRWTIALLTLVPAACRSAPGCSSAAPAGATFLTSPGHEAFRAAAPDTFRAVFETSRGDFSVRIVRAWAPRGADRFYNLVRNGFYDGTRFFRAVSGFVVQWGVHGDPRVTQAWARQCIEDDPVRRTNARRTLTFAFGRPGTRTTQIFINLGMNRRLDPLGFAPIGEVVAGMEVVDSLYAGYGDRPPTGNGPDPVILVEEGNAYLAREFPKLDSIVRARIELNGGNH
jgi:peptidyl-prolyl cis-trans isomerase A (cyclophilin A)